MLCKIQLKSWNLLNTLHKHIHLTLSRYVNECSKGPLKTNVNIGTLALGEQPAQYPMYHIKCNNNPSRDSVPNLCYPLHSTK